MKRGKWGERPRIGVELPPLSASESRILTADKGAVKFTDGANNVSKAGAICRAAEEGVPEKILSRM